MDAPARRGGLGLKADSLRLWHLVAVGLAFQSLALVVYLNVGFIEQTAGPVAPVVFLLVTLISIPTAISFAVMSNRRPSAGTAFTWLWETTVPPVGLWLGWLMASAYTMASILQPVMFGLFFNALLRFLGIPTSLATAVLGGLLVTALVGWTTYKQVQISARLIGVFLAVEASFVVLLVLVIVIRQGLHGNLSLDPFNPAAATGGVHGIFLAVLFGLLAISGFDVVTPVAEETRTPDGSSRWRPSWSRWYQACSGCSPPTASWCPCRSTRWSTSSWPPERSPRSTWSPPAMSAG